MSVADLLNIGAALLVLAFRAQGQAAAAGSGGGGGGGSGGSGGSGGGGGENPKGPLDDLTPTLRSGPVEIFGDDFVGPVKLKERAPGQHWEYILLKSRP